MYNVNGPPRGANVTADQSSYDIIYKDVIINNSLGSYNGSAQNSSNTTTWSYNLQNDNFNNIYKVEVVSAIMVFTSIPNNIKNKSILLQIPQLNGNTVNVAGNVSQSNSQQGTNSVQSMLFCQIPDNSSNNASTTTISLFSTPSFNDVIQFYNPPLSKVNRIDVQWVDQLGNIITGDKFTSWYFTLRIHYLQKRNNTSAISVPTFTITGTGSLDSLYQPSRSR